MRTQCCPEIKAEASNLVESLFEDSYSTKRLRDSGMTQQELQDKARRIGLANDLTEQEITAIHDHLLEALFQQDP